MEALTIPPRFCGPPSSGNGGYVCGRVAAYISAPATVTLRRPVPLGTALAVEPDGDGSVRVRDGATLIAEARPAPDAPDLVSPAQPRPTASRARYFEDPVFPDCFVCGPARPPGDGLRIFPGPVPGPIAGPFPGPIAGSVAGRELWAASWTPDPSVAGPDGRVRAEIVWAALDCPSGIAAAAAAGRDTADAAGLDTAILLGRMTARLAARPEVAQPCQVLAWPGGRDGRKLTAFSALLGPAGEVLAAARVLWLTVPRPASGGTS